MFKFIVLLSIAACVYAASVPNGLLPQLDGRIVGGKPTTIEKFPWQVSLQRSGSHFCGGSLYSNNIVVTAAHCLEGITASSMQVRVGSTNWNKGGVLMKVAAVKSHEQYNPATMMNDIALLRLSSPVTFGPTVKSIPLAEQTPKSGAHAAVTGWGTTFSGASTLPTTLQTVKVKMVSLEECASSAYGYGSDVQPTMVCAYSEGKDSCQGDSGGPLVSGGRLVGVVSWGYGCAFENYPGVYADVAHLNQWVVATASDL